MTVCFALDLSPIRSPASLLSQSSAVFFCLSKASGGKCSSPVCGFPGTLWVGAFLVVAFSHLHAFLISGIDPPWNHFPRCTGAEGGEATESSGSADGSRALCSNVISITLTESLEGSNDDLSFLSRLPVGFFFFFYENRCHEKASMIVGKMIADCVFKNKASIANQTLRSLFDFLYDVTVFLLFSVWGKK